MGIIVIDWGKSIHPDQIDPLCSANILKYCSSRFEALVYISEHHLSIYMFTVLFKARELSSEVEIFVKNIHWFYLHLSGDLRLVEC